MPGNVLEDTDMIHEDLGREKQGGKEAIQHPG